MRAYDCIRKKRDGYALTEEEMRFLVNGYVEGSIPDYQMAAFLMAVYYKGMTEEEISIMTDIVTHSGDTVDLSGIEGVKVMTPVQDEIIHTITIELNGYEPLPVIKHHE